jgi:diguanylate cyclase (GGDEF)-like protein
MITKVIRFVESRLNKFTTTGRAWVIIASALLVMVIDYLTGSLAPMGVYYLIPVTMSTWYFGRLIGWATVTIASVLLSTVVISDFGSSDIIRRAIQGRIPYFLFGIFYVVVVDNIQKRLRMEQVASRTCSLTGLFNHRGFIQELEEMLEVASRTNADVSLAYIDLDNFKGVNDSKGHAEGDRVLKHVANVLSTYSRKTDRACRVGGDEFAVIMLSGTIGAKHHIEMLHKRMSQGKQGIGSSVGCITFSSPLPTVHQAIESADALMYKVKRNGKNRCSFEVI